MDCVAAKPDPARDQELIRHFLASLAASSLSVDISDLLQRVAAPASDPGSSSKPSSDLNVTAADATDKHIRDFDLNDPVFQDENEPEPEYEHENAVGHFENTSSNLSQPSGNDSDSSSLPSHASNGDSQVHNMSLEKCFIFSLCCYMPWPTMLFSSLLCIPAYVCLYYRKHLCTFLYLCLNFLS